MDGGFEVLSGVKDVIAYNVKELRIISHINLSKINII